MDTLPYRIVPTYLGAANKPNSLFLFLSVHMLNFEYNMFTVLALFACAGKIDDHSLAL